MLYGGSTFQRQGGLHWLIEFSRASLAEQFAQVLRSTPPTLQPPPMPSLESASGSSSS